jgi:hypothetical protein
VGVKLRTFLREHFSPREMLKTLDGPRLPETLVLGTHGIVNIS